MSTVETKLAIWLELACESGKPQCADFSNPLYDQLRTGKYDEMSVLNLQPLEHWRPDHRTARKRADRAERRGYRFVPFNRANWTMDLNRINQSATHRQGRPMSGSYLTWQDYPALPEYPCRRHAIRDYGVFVAGKLVAYSFVYRAGELALVSQILGHAAHLENEIMYLLMQGVIEAENNTDPHGYLVYNRHDSGTKGLRFFKERCGFEPMAVEWLP